MNRVRHKGQPHIAYALRVYKPADLSQTIDVFAEILIEFATRTKNEALAISLRSLCTASSRVYLQFVGRGRLAHCRAFDRCFCCGKWSRDTVVMDAAFWGSLQPAVVETCADCFFDKKMAQPSRLVDGTVAIEAKHAATLRLSHTFCSAVKTEVRLIARHTWWHTSTKQFVYLIAVSLSHARFRAKPLTLTIPLRKAVAEKLCGRRVLASTPLVDTVTFWKTVFTEALLKKRDELLEKIAYSAQCGAFLGAPDELTRLPCSRRKPAPPFRLPPCTHTYAKPLRGALLVKCSACKSRRQA